MYKSIKLKIQTINNAYKNFLGKILGWTILETYFFREKDKGIHFLKNLYYDKSFFAFYIERKVIIEILFFRIPLNMGYVWAVNTIKILYFLIGILIITKIPHIKNIDNIIMIASLLLTYSLFFFDHININDIEEEE